MDLLISVTELLSFFSHLNMQAYSISLVNGQNVNEEQSDFVRLTPDVNDIV